MSIEWSLQMGLGCTATVRTSHYLSSNYSDWNVVLLLDHLDHPVISLKVLVVATEMYARYHRIYA